MVDELKQIRNLEDENPQCQNCIDLVFMDRVGDRFYRCPVCGDETDLSDPGDDDLPEYEPEYWEAEDYEGDYSPEYDDDDDQDAG